MTRSSVSICFDADFNTHSSSGVVVSGKYDSRSAFSNTCLYTVRSSRPVRETYKKLLASSVPAMKHFAVCHAARFELALDLFRLPERSNTQHHIYAVCHIHKRRVEARRRTVPYGIARQGTARYVAARSVAQRDSM